MRRSLVLLVLVATLTAFVAIAPPAGAHAVFVGPTSFEAGSSNNAVNLNVPHEKGEGIWNVEIAVQIPAGWQAQSCAPKPTWTCSINSGVVRWTKSGDPAEDEGFQFVVRAPNQAPQTFEFPTVQYYSDGTNVLWGPPSEPAPTLSTYPKGATPPPPAPPTPPPTHGGGGGSGGSGASGGSGSSGGAVDPGGAVIVPGEEAIVPYPDFGTGATTVAPTTAPPAGEAAAEEEEERDDERRRRDEDDDADEVELASTSSETDSGGSSPLLFILPALAVLAAAGAGVYFWQKRTPSAPTPTAPADTE